jgi:hypothetical protein
MEFLQISCVEQSKGIKKTGPSSLSGFSYVVVLWRAYGAGVGNGVAILAQPKPL